MHSAKNEGPGRNDCRLRLILVVLLVLLVFTLLLPAAIAQAVGQIGPQAQRQIEAIMQEKLNRTPAQMKIDSHVLYELKTRRGEFLGTDVPQISSGLNVDAQYRAKVSIRAHVDDALIHQLKARGVEILNTSESMDSILAKVPLANLESVAAIPQVRFISREFGYMTHAVNPPVRGASFAMRVQNVRSAISAAVKLASSTNVLTFPPSGQGSQSSEGDQTHRAVDARNTFHVDGTGLKIGVLSNGVDGLAQSQASGDLGAVTVLPGQAGSGAEGTAMLEIVHDLAPGAQLYFATADPTITQFAQNIRDLRTAGCDIIVDDVFYFVESPFQDGQNAASQYNGAVVTQAVKDVTTAGALYFSSAGNEGNVAQGTAGVWEGDFRDGGAVSGPITSPPYSETGRVHDFGGGQTYDLYGAGQGYPIILHWNDPLGQSNNDYDLFVLNAAGTAVTDYSNDRQTGTQDPLEGVNAPANGSRLVIVKFSGSDRYLHLNTFRGTLSKATTGQTHGHSSADSIGAYSVAATPAAAPFGNSTAGPFPNPFSVLNQTETFTSDGRRRIFYDNTGTALNADLTSTGGKLLNKPDITAADGVSVTGNGGFPNPFYGTSASAPHAAAIAALIKQAIPGISQSTFRTLLINSATDILPAGYDVNSGNGIINAWKALFNAGVPGTADLEPGVIQATENPGDGDGAISPGEGGKLVIPLKNVGVHAATNIRATLTTNTPGVTLFMPNTQSYPNLNAQGGTASNTYLFTLTNALPCPAVIDFALTINYSDGTSPRVLNFKVPTGSVPISISSTLDTTAPGNGAHYTATTGLQTARIFRDGVTGTCAAPKTFPGTSGSGTRRFDAYTFNTCSYSSPGCATATLSGANASNLFNSTYLGSFNPANIGQNYLSDPGSSASSRTHSFPLGAGAQTFVEVVNEVTSGAGIGVAYKLDVSGACISSCTVNHPPVAKAKDITVTSGFGCVANANVNDGSYDPDPGDTITVTQSPAGPYPVGVTPVILTVKDSKGAFSQATANVTVLAASQSSLSAAILYVPPVKARLTFTDLVYASCAKVAPTGTVTFTDVKTNTVLGTVPLNASGKVGQATLTIERVRPVNMSVKASYSGDSNTAGSSAGPKLVFAY